MVVDGVGCERSALGAEVVTTALEKLEKELVGFGDGGEGAGVVGNQDSVELGVVMIVYVSGDFGEGVLRLFCGADVFDDIGKISLFVFFGATLHEGEVEVAVFRGVSLNVAEFLFGLDFVVF